MAFVRLVLVQMKLFYSKECPTSAAMTTALCSRDLASLPHIRRCDMGLCQCCVTRRGQCLVTYMEVWF